MARPLRYEAAGAVYFVMSRGDGGMTVTVPDARLQDQRNLLARTMHALNENALDIGGLGWASTPDDVRAIAKSGDGVWDGAMDFRTL